MEDLFSNPYSEIPDQLWKSPSSAERQLAAVRYWADLRGVEKQASDPEKFSKTSKLRIAIRKQLSRRNAREVLAGSIAGALGAGASIYNTRKKPQPEPLDVGKGHQTKNPTAEQLDYRASRAALNEDLARGRAGKLKQKAQEIKEDLARFRADNRLLSAAIEGGLTAGAAALLVNRMKRGK